MVRQAHHKLGPGEPKTDPSAKLRTDTYWSMGSFDSREGVLGARIKACTLGLLISGPSALDQARRSMLEFVLVPRKPTPSFQV